ncbi:MAG: response regulator transcription factor [Eubacterium sp.]|nr:response regulator transcription factor [Eubacterium sp.]
MESRRILIVEDDKEIRELLGTYLGGQGYDIDYAENGLTADRKLMEYLGGRSTEPLSLVLLDIMLPLMSGDQILQKLREKSDIPVIIISAKDMVQTKIDVIRMGADDYITKPFDLGEVLVRIEALLRRSGSRMSDADKLSVKDLVLSKGDGRVFIAGEEIVLTSREFAILELLLSYPDKIFSKANIFDAIWDEESAVYDDNAVKVHMSNLRKKLSQHSGEEYIETVWGMGYRLAK